MDTLITSFLLSDLLKWGCVIWLCVLYAVKYDNGYDSLSAINHTSVQYNSSVESSLCRKDVKYVLRICIEVEGMS